MERIAVLDIGTNTIILLVAEKHGARDFKVIHDEAMVVRLGEGINHNHAFLPQAMARAYDALKLFAGKIHDADCRVIKAVATAGFRQARNSPEFAERIKNELGIAITTISGDEEARLIAVAAKADFSHLSRPLVIMDIGGGSTEFINDDGKKDDAVSLPFGSVKLHERFLKSDPPTQVEIDALVSFIKKEMTQLPRHKNTQLVACAGTATTLSAMHLGLTQYDSARVHKSVLPRAGLVKLIELYRLMPLASRRNLPCLEPLRADVIIAGAHILLVAMDYYDVSECHISDRGLRYGVLLES